MDDKKKDRVVNPAIDDIKKIITNIKKYDATFYYLNDFTVNIKGDFTKEDIENNEIISSGIDKFIYKATKEVIDKFIEEFKTEKINKTEKLLKICENCEIYSKKIKENIAGTESAALNEDFEISPLAEPRIYDEPEFLIKLKYMDEEEYENIDKLYTSLFFTCQKDEGGWAEELRAIVDGPLSGTMKKWVGGGREPPKGVPDSIESFGEEFMPESYYHKEQSELIIEYLVFLSEKSFKQFKKVCIYLLNVTYKILEVMLKLAFKFTYSCLVACLHFILANYLKPILALLDNLNPFKTSLENDEKKGLEEEIERQRELIEKHEIDIRNLQNKLNSCSSTWLDHANEYTYQLLSVASGPILLAIRQHAQQRIGMEGAGLFLR
tara:strand:- start:627 stop:1766 length:1140 start_codon:yes stop_codon:yes gene_type:complete